MRYSDIPSSRRLAAGWLAAGLALTGLMLGLRWLSPVLEPNGDAAGAAIIAVVGLMVAAGGIYLLVLWHLKGTGIKRGPLKGMILVGIAMRLVMFDSTPILEDDHNRYLWDGGVLANGFNPYGHTPQDVLRAQRPGIPEALHQLSLDAGGLTGGINFPWLRTIYPPVTEACFALAHWLKPWSLDAWRFILLLLDGLSLWLLYHLLGRLGLPLWHLVIFWWNPLLIKEIYNSAHMEMILIPLILGTLLLGLRGNYLAAMVVLGLAVGTKFWPLLLAPILLRPLLGDPRRLVPALLVLAGLSGLMLMPFYLSGLDSQAGFTAYGKSWQMNDSAFMLILWLMEWILTTMGWGLGWAQPLARMAVGSILFTWLLWLLREEAEDEKAVVRRCLMATAALFLLSPTQFPWYALWMLPFLALCPRISLLLLSALLPIYYLRFYFSARAQAPIFDHGIVWLQYVPVWGLLAWEWHRGPKVHEAPVETRGDSGHGL